MVKAFLKGADGTLFPLLPKVTTIGRENCDFTIQLAGVDYQHCVLEYSEHDDCFVLQDLNTAQGTYVNDVRVQNAAVRLAPGDNIRFGYNGQPFELQLENITATQMSSIPPVSQRPPVWTQPLMMLGDDSYNVSSSQYYGSAHGLPHISYANSQPQITTPVWTHLVGPPPPMPRPPLRSRPLSAGAAAARRNVQNIPPVGPGISRTATAVGGWTNPQPFTRTSSIPDLQAQEKDQRLQQLNEEVTRLRSLEFDGVRKDTLIIQLQQQVEGLQNKIQQEPSIIMGGDADISSKLLHLETEVTAKSGEITALKEQLGRLQSDRSSSPQLLRQELGERVKEISQLRLELDRVKKDKNITSGLVTQMQRDMTNKDSTISRLTREIEVLKKDIRERDVQMSASSRKSPKQTEENNARDKELVSLRQKFKTSESKIQEQTDLINALKEELEKIKAQSLTDKEAQNKLESDLEVAKAQVLDIQRSERVVRVDLEQSQKRMERFRSRVVQVTFSTPGFQTPEKELSDDELIEYLKQLIQERVDLLAKVKSLEADVKKAASGKDELLVCAGTLREALEASQKRLQQNGRLASSLKKEIAMVQSLLTDDDLLWMRDMYLNMMEAEMGWEMSTEAALDKCGVNLKISEDPPGKHIEALHLQWESSINQKQRLENQIEENLSNHKHEMEHALDALTKDLDNRIADAVEKARLEGEEKLNMAIDEIRAAEEEKRQCCLDVERRKVEELEAVIAQLRGSVAERTAEDQVKLQEAAACLAELESLRKAEVSLKEQLINLEKSRTEDLDKFSLDKDELAKKYDLDVETYKEQIKQHSVTICTLEERIEKMVKKYKDLQENMSKLKSERTKPVPSPKPKVIVQRPREEISALEHVVNALRQENTVLKKEIRDSQDIIRGLRRDLNGASARLSDISGEMNEAQKQEMERNRDMLNQRGSELTELRQQLAKLSKIVDNQKEEVKKLETDLSVERSTVVKYKKDLEESKARLILLEEELCREKEEQKKQLDLIDQEGRITSELTSLGAQCRGERHEQIISRQREALAELRSKVKNLEHSRPPLPTQDQALQQVVLLKKELAEMRVNQALAEDKIIQNATSLDREIGKARGLITPSNVEADMERSAHRETMDSLEASEATYLTLLRAMAASLDLEEIEGLRPMAHIPKDERDNLIELREGACQLLANRVQVLKERIARKDELLQGYEMDLAKLRQSQELAEMKSHQVETLANDVRSRAEESQYLRESLNRTRDRLNQEKRLNTAIKSKKTYHLENERSHVRNGTARGYHCPIEDPRAEVKRRQQKDLLKRKNYEIKTLKSDLCSTEQSLFEKEKKLMSMETNLGLQQAGEMLF